MIIFLPEQLKAMGAMVIVQVTATYVFRIAIMFPFLSKNFMRFDCFLFRLYIFFRSIINYIFKLSPSFVLFKSYFYTFAAYVITASIASGVYCILFKIWGYFTYQLSLLTVSVLRSAFAPNVMYSNLWYLLIGLSLVNKHSALRSIHYVLLGIIINIKSKMFLLLVSSNLFKIKNIPLFALYSNIQNVCKNIIITILNININFSKKYI